MTKIELLVSTTCVPDKNGLGILWDQADVTACFCIFFRSLDNGQH